jgi:hypothetical protein
VDDIFAQDDTDGDGNISASEFQNAQAKRAQEHAGGSSLDRVLMSLVQQYTAVGTSSDTGSALSAVA